MPFCFFWISTIPTNARFTSNIKIGDIREFGVFLKYQIEDATKANRQTGKIYTTDGMNFDHEYDQEIEGLEISVSAIGNDIFFVVTTVNTGTLKLKYKIEKLKDN